MKYIITLVLTTAFTLSYAGNNPEYRNGLGIKAPAYNSQTSLSAAAGYGAAPFEIFGFKIGPIFYGIRPVGVEGGLEFSGSDFISVAVYIRQNFGFDIDQGGGTITAASHTIIEPQLRFWPDQIMQGPFFALLGKYYLSGEIGGGFVFGWLINAGGLTIEGFAGIQTQTEVEKSYTTPVFLRYGLNIGFQNQ